MANRKLSVATLQRLARRLPRVCANAALALAATGCTAGLIYEDVGHPPIQVGASGDRAVLGWDPHLNASMGGRQLVKRGVACSRDILKLVAWGDGTQAAAAKEGGITQVVGVDFDNMAILGFIYTKSCTIVYGNDSQSAAAPAPIATPVPPQPVTAPAPAADETVAPATAAGEPLAPAPATPTMAADPAPAGEPTP